MILKAQQGLNTQDIKDNPYANQMQQLNGNIQQGAQQLGQKVQQEIQAEQNPNQLHGAVVTAKRNWQPGQYYNSKGNLAINAEDVLKNGYTFVTRNDGKLFMVDKNNRYRVIIPDIAKSPYLMDWIDKNGLWDKAQNLTQAGQRMMVTNKDAIQQVRDDMRWGGNVAGAGLAAVALAPAAAELALSVPAALQKGTQYAVERILPNMNLGTLGETLLTKAPQSLMNQGYKYPLLFANTGFGAGVNAAQTSYFSAEALNQLKQTLKQKGSLFEPTVNVALALSPFTGATVSRINQLRQKVLGNALGLYLYRNIKNTPSNSREIVDALAEDFLTRKLTYRPSYKVHEVSPEVYELNKDFLEPGEKWFTHTYLEPYPNNMISLQSRLPKINNNNELVPKLGFDVGNGNRFTAIWWNLNQPYSRQLYPFALERPVAGAKLVKNPTPFQQEGFITTKEVPTQGTTFYERDPYSGFYGRGQFVSTFINNPFNPSLDAFPTPHMVDNYFNWGLHKLISPYNSEAMQAFGKFFREASVHNINGKNSFVQAIEDKRFVPFISKERLQDVLEKRNTEAQDIYQKVKNFTREAEKEKGYNVEELQSNIYKSNPWDKLRQYPELKMVQQTDLDDPFAQGDYSKGSNLIRLSQTQVLHPNILVDLKTYKPIMAHETQHYYQAINPTYFNLDTWDPNIKYYKVNTENPLINNTFEPLKYGDTWFSSAREFQAEVARLKQKLNNTSLFSKQPPKNQQYIIQELSDTFDLLPSEVKDILTKMEGKFERGGKLIKNNK